MEDETTLSLITHLKARMTNPLLATDGAHILQPTIAPPATMAAITAAEDELGFALPPVLRRIYSDAGNGGFGPGYGLVGIRDGVLDHTLTIVDLYSEFREPRPDDPAWQWPEKLLPICHLGCGMYACADCSTPQGAMVWYEPNPREPGQPLEQFLIPVANSLAEWLWSWVYDQDWMEAAYSRSALKQWRDNGYVWPAK